MFISFYFQFVTILNFFSNIYIILLLFIFGYLEIVSEGFVVLSLITIFTQGFSTNIRNIYLGSSDVLYLKKIILFRIYIGTIGCLITGLCSYIFFGKSYILFHISLIFLTVINWILELVIARYEKLKTINIYYIVNFLFFLFSSLYLIFSRNILFLSIFLFCYSLLNILIFRKVFRNILNQNLFLKKLKLNLGIFSTLLKTVANFSWRYFIFIFFGTAEASILFIGFTLGSFFGTVFDISYGALFIKKFNNKKSLINIFFIIYTSLVSFFIYLIKAFSNFDNEQFNILLTTTIFSIFGGYLTIQALSRRQLFFEEIKLRKTCYEVDICIYLFNFLIIPVLYYLNKNYLIMSYFVSSLFFYFVYIILFKNVYSKKIY
jgi:NADH:ubiquinone oxidoreductase subunit K